jgi:hypothetical protein
VRRVKARVLKKTEAEDRDQVLTDIATSLRRRGNPPATISVIPVPAIFRRGQE